MIGTLIFADIPLATVGAEDIIWGWKDQCPSEDIWNKVPANDNQWSAELKASNIWNKSPARKSEWQKQDTASSRWEKQDPRVDDHKKC